MTRESLESSLDILEAMNTGRDGDGKWEGLRKLYVIALMPLADEEGIAAVTHAAMNENWRPSPARLLEIAAELASPVPDDEATYAEILHKAQSLGTYARPHPDKPSILLEGPPNFSHPFVEQIVRYCGGWAFICTGESNMAEGLKKQVRSAHESVASEWRAEVKKQLALPPDRRNPRMFPEWKRHQLPSSWTPDFEIPALEPIRANLDKVPVAPNVRKFIAQHWKDDTK